MKILPRGKLRSSSCEAAALSAILDLLGRTSSLFYPDSKTHPSFQNKLAIETKINSPVKKRPYILVAHAAHIFPRQVFCKFFVSFLTPDFATAFNAREGTKFLGATIYLFLLLAIV